MQHDNPNVKTEISLTTASLRVLVAMYDLETARPNACYPQSALAAAAGYQSRSAVTRPLARLWSHRLITNASCPRLTTAGNRLAVALKLMHDDMQAARRPRPIRIAGDLERSA